MEWDDPRQVDFSTLLVALDWVQRHCVVPDGDERGRRFELVPWQALALANFYRLKSTAKPDERAAAFRYRRGQIILPQKAGKAPYTAAHICVEGVGPALFAGWAQGGETWDCRDHGCGCGWIYEYRPGEAMGRVWPTPLIQITAFSEDQTDNIYGALRPMIDDGPLTELIPKTGEEFIRLPHGGRIDVVTSNARSRLGARVTYVPQDETGIWTPATGMVKVAQTQRRGLAGMGGRAEETSNAWDPNEESVAQLTAESKQADIYRLHPLAPEGLSYRNKAERRKIHRYVYRGCDWINLDSIEPEAAELLETDPAQAERFFGNRPVAGSGKAFNGEKWDGCLKQGYQPDKGAFVVVGIDGARFHDDLGIVATEVATGHQFVLGHWSRPPGADDDYEHPLDAVEAVLQDAWEHYAIWRIYIDPGSSGGNIDYLSERLMERWGKVGPEAKSTRTGVVPWYMHRPRQTAEAVANYTDAIVTGAVSHDGHEALTQHVKNAVRWLVNVRDDEGHQLHVIGKDRPNSPNKIDLAAAAVLSWECRGDARAKGAKPKRPAQWLVT